jgi:NADH dehydrogenase
MIAPKTILVIGGGFAGFWAAIAARRVAGSQADVTLVSSEPVLEIRPRLYEARPDTLGVDLLPLLRRVDVSFVRGEATQLDTAAKAMTLATGDRLAYDRRRAARLRPKVPAKKDRADRAARSTTCQAYCATTLACRACGSAA